MRIHEIIALITLFLWLTLGTIWDLRAKDHKLPLWFSLVLLLPGPQFVQYQKLVAGPQKGMGYPAGTMSPKGCCATTSPGGVHVLPGQLLMFFLSRQ
jgi:hypothetical protein